MDDAPSIKRRNSFRLVSDVGGEVHEGDVDVGNLSTFDAKSFGSQFNVYLAIAS
jgi:hypothetical protein